MPLNYSECGVSVARNDYWVKKLSKMNITDGGFASLWEEDGSYWVSSTDGIGSKLILAKECSFPKWTYSLGQDLVAMVVNDIITTGANPLFLLDYLAVHQIGDIDLSQLLLGIRDSCRLVGCQLLGGETSELPNIIPKGLFDVAGFGIGKILKTDLWGMDRVKNGDVIIGLESSGPHSNGFSLIRRIHSNSTFSKEELERLLVPTSLYVSIIKEIKQTYSEYVHAAANITGGGLVGNLTRVIPEYLYPHITYPPIPSLFRTIQEKGNISEEELRKVLNCGIGFCLIVNPFCLEEILSICQSFFSTQILGIVVQKE